MVLVKESSGRIFPTVSVTLWEPDTAIEHGPFIDDFPIIHSDFQ